MAATILQLSDTHLAAEPGAARHGRDPDRRLAATVAAVAGRRVDLVLLTGDITDDGSEAGCRRAAEAVAVLGAPVVAVAGNHDGGPEVAAVFGPPSPVAVGGWRVVAVSSRLPGRVEGAVDPDAVLRLLRDTAGEADGGGGRPTVLAVHHPPVGPSTHPWFQLGGAAGLLTGLDADPAVRLVLSGHLHEPFERRRGDLAVLGAPSTLYAIRHTGDRWEADDSVLCGARLVHLDAGGEWRTELVGIPAEAGAVGVGTAAPDGR